MKKLSLIFLAAGMGFMLYSCASTIPHSDAVHQAWAQKHWNNIHLSEARDIYASNCSGCHSLHAPCEHTEKEWTVLFPEMAGKAHLIKSDSIAIIAFLETYSKDNRMMIQ